MSEADKEARSWRSRQEEPAPDPLNDLMRELQRRRDLKRTWRVLTRDYLNGRN